MAKQTFDGYGPGSCEAAVATCGGSAHPPERAMHMNVTRLLPALLLFAPLLAAQDPAGAEAAMPNPKHAEHAALTPFVGTWNCKVKMYQGPEPMEMAATETFELLCSGLWLKSTVQSTFMGQPFQGISLLGFDPKAKHYVNVWADSMAPIATVSHTAHDPKTRTWSSKLVSGHGPARSSLVWKDADTIVETSYAAGPDGKETVAMEIVRKRGGKATSTTAAGPGSVSPSSSTTAPASVGSAPTAAGAAPGAPSATTTPPDAVVADMARIVGTWNAVTRMTGPDGTATAEQGSETVTSVCNGQWQWSDYSGLMMGMPFEGHGLVGYDPTTQKVTTFWIDNFSPFVTVLTGGFDAKANAIVSSGMCCDPTGAEGEMSCTAIWKDANTRVSKMTHAMKEGSMSFDIEYTRITPVPGAAPRK